MPYRIRAIISAVVRGGPDGRPVRRTRRRLEKVSRGGRSKDSSEIGNDAGRGARALSDGWPAHGDPRWRWRTAMDKSVKAGEAEQVGLWIGGKRRSSTSTRFGDVTNPA